MKVNWSSDYSGTLFVQNPFHVRQTHTWPFSLKSVDYKIEKTLCKSKPNIDLDDSAHSAWKYKTTHFFRYRTEFHLHYKRDINSFKTIVSSMLNVLSIKYVSKIKHSTRCIAYRYRLNKGLLKNFHKIVWTLTTKNMSLGVGCGRWVASEWCRFDSSCLNVCMICINILKERKKNNWKKHYHKTTNRIKELKKVTLNKITMTTFVSVANLQATKGQRFKSLQKGTYSVLLFIS